MNAVVSPPLDPNETQRHRTARAIKSFLNVALTLADGIIVVIPLVLSVSILLILAKPLKSWISEFLVLVGGFVAGSLIGAGIGWRVGRHYVLGRWLSANWRRRCVESIGWIAGVGVAIVLFHHLMMPLAEKLEAQITSIRDRIEKKSSEARSSIEQGNLFVAKGVMEAGQRLVEDGQKKIEEAKREGNQGLLRDGNEQVDEGRKLLKVADDIASNPTRDPKNDLKSFDVTVLGLTEATETNRISNATSTGGFNPALLPILLAFPEVAPLFGLSWAFGGREVLQEQIIETTRGKPPTLEDMLKLLDKLDSQDPAYRRKAVEKLREVVSNLAAKGRIKQAEWEKFDEDSRKLVDELKKKEASSWESTLRSRLQVAFARLPSDASEGDLGKAAFDTVSRTLERNQDDKPEFASRAQKESVRSIFAQERASDWQVLWKRIDQEIHVRGASLGK